MEPVAEIKFKPMRRRNMRQRKCSSDEDEDDRTASEQTNTHDLESIKLAETRERQKLRIKPNGVNIIGMALGKKISTVEEQVTTVKDAYSKMSGGMVNMNALKAGKVNVKPTEDAYDVGIGTQFSAETNKRDEDEEMMKYIEDQLSKRKKGAEADANGDDDDDEANALKYMSPEEAALLALPDHLRVGSAHRSEEMLSNQMLNGIPEVDLGIEAKIRNIEATEAAKEKLLQEQKNKADGPSHFVPTNMAVNFVQHNRFNLDSSHGKRRGYPHAQHQPHNQHHHNSNQGQGQSGQQGAVQRTVGSVGGATGQDAKPRNTVGGGSTGNNGQPHKGGGRPGGIGVKRATDDYHYDKFKKQFRRY